jgi:hypothetical protein
MANITTSAQICEKYKISHRSLLRMIHRGELIPAEKLPGDTGAYLFDPKQVERVFARRAAAAEDVPA